MRTHKLIAEGGQKEPRQLGSLLEERDRVFKTFQEDYGIDLLNAGDNLQKLLVDKAHARNFETVDEFRMFQRAIEDCEAVCAKIVELIRADEKSAGEMTMDEHHDNIRSKIVKLRRTFTYIRTAWAAAHLE